MDVSRIHYDIPNVELFGAYMRQLEDKATATEEQVSSGSEGEAGRVSGPKPMYGRTKSGRKNVKQIQFGINVTRDGAVPIGHISLDGNTAEAKTHLENLKLLDNLLPHSRRLYTADAKLDTPENLLGGRHQQGTVSLCGRVSTAFEEGVSQAGTACSRRKQS